MGTSISLLNWRQNKIATEVKRDNARLEARIQRLSEEATRLKTDIREIAELIPVQKVRFGKELPQCLLTDSKSNTYVQLTLP